MSAEVVAGLIPAPRSRLSAGPAAGRVTLKAINWNRIIDTVDLDVWNKLTGQYWRDANYAISNDIPSWGTLSPAEQRATMRAFTGLTLLDTVQSMVGAIVLMEDAVTPHEVEVFTNIAFMESMHAKSYSKVFSTLCPTHEIDEVFRWSEENPLLQAKVEIIMRHYAGDDGPLAALKRKHASVMLESFLFYSGFFLILHWASRAKLTNVADMVRAIIKDEAVHGFYIGYKAQRAREALSEEQKAELHEWTVNLKLDLYDNEVRYTRDLYDDLGLSEQVITFLQYNGNKAMQNLGYDGLFRTTQADVNPAIMAQLSTDNENGDFFSGKNGYVMPEVEELDEDDYDF